MVMPAPAAAPFLTRVMTPDPTAAQILLAPPPRLDFDRLGERRDM